MVEFQAPMTSGSGLNTGPDILDFLRREIGFAIKGAGAVAITIGTLAAAYVLWLAPVRRVYTQEFRPTFPGVEDRQYPNGTPFAPTDIIAPSLLNAVYEADGLKDFCPQEDFRSAWFVDQHSRLATVVDAQYAAALAEPRLTAVERERLVGEYRARRDGLPVELRLEFVQPAACASVPRTIVAKFMSDVLAGWASDANVRRGAFRLNADVISPTIFDAVPTQVDAIVRIDFVRANLTRVLDAVVALMAVDGAGAARLPGRDLSFADLQARLHGLLRTDVALLTGQALRASTPASEGWVSSVTTLARRDAVAAESRVKALEAALAATADPGAGGTTVAADAARVQVDGTFLTEMLGLVDANREVSIKYRQRLADELLDARQRAVAPAERAAYYENLAAAIRSNPHGSLPADFDAKLGALITVAKALTADVNALYESLSSDTLRAASSMFTLGQPMYRTVERSLGWIGWVQLTAALFAGAAVLILSVRFLRELFGARPTAHA
jgi:hypothetical protein